MPVLRRDWLAKHALVGIKISCAYKFFPTVLQSTDAVASHGLITKYFPWICIFVWYPVCLRAARMTGTLLVFEEITTCLLPGFRMILFHLFPQSGPNEPSYRCESKLTLSYCPSEEQLWSSGRHCLGSAWHWVIQNWIIIIIIHPAQASWRGKLAIETKTIFFTSLQICLF